MQRNKFMCPVGHSMTAEEERLTRLARQKNDEALTKQLQDHFLKLYPLADEADEADEEVDLLGEELSPEEMRAFLRENGVAVSPNAKEETIRNKYNTWVEENAQA